MSRTGTTRPAHAHATTKGKPRGRYCPLCGGYQPPDDKGHQCPARAVK